MADGFTSAEGATRMTTERVTPGVWIALGSAAVLLLYLIAGPGFHGMTGFGTGVVAGLLGAYGLLKLYRQTPPAPAAAAGPAAAGVARPDRSDAEALNLINLRVRSAGLAPDLVERIERLIDQLAELLPTLSGQFAGFELTWQMQQIASAYLPKLVNAYVSLGDAERSQRRSEFEASLGELEDAAARTGRALREQRTTEFENISQFLKVRFS
jgi:hypothetical protein